VYILAGARIYCPHTVFTDCLCNPVRSFGRVLTNIVVGMICSRGIDNGRKDVRENAARNELTTLVLDEGFRDQAVDYNSRTVDDCQILELNKVVLNRCKVAQTHHIKSNRLFLQKVSQIPASAPSQPLRPCNPVLRQPDPFLKPICFSPRCHNGFIQQMCLGYSCFIAYRVYIVYVCTDTFVFCSICAPN
jgi:hypothetical protein